MPADLAVGLLQRWPQSREASRLTVQPWSSLPTIFVIGDYADHFLRSSTLRFAHSNRRRASQSGFERAPMRCTAITRAAAVGAAASAAQRACECPESAGRCTLSSAQAPACGRLAECERADLIFWPN